MNYLPPRRSDGTIQKRREPLPWPKDRPFRILSIDGGGICGILPAALLGEIERRFLGGRSIAGYFDMVAGTSTGGIIALALGAGMTSAAIRDIYVERGGIIFGASFRPHLAAAALAPSLALHLHLVGRRTFTSELLSLPSTRRNRSRGSVCRATGR